MDFTSLLNAPGAVLEIIIPADTTILVENCASEACDRFAAPAPDTKGYDITRMKWLLTVDTAFRYDPSIMRWVISQ